ncbi:unnamed protein product [Rotaria socialis]|uniref:tRNA-splicing endonuclease subunit Sen15 domain-containing protein n=1 Tax=Rotaria socialis TaxID=392032 RepID=A0A819AJQ0_9BILA|nr:unnamed protein product [Rotaria socialis]CAF3235382.1 unnamed protein product [Rotaria socialis]CAF3327671.1 unnamed protein product [Rotaria socialis]CAF3406681.1 unnamed protein product [Rotaria socialis]CAF3785014.1 unnamed protein product [Rotaria socialis]
MNLCDAKQKSFAQRVYFDLKICRKWSKLNTYFDEINKWIFFVGKPSDNESWTFVLPISSDEELSVDDLFNLRTKLSSSLPSNINENISSVLMAIIANDFTLGYFNFSFGLPSPSTSSNIIAQTEISNNQIVSTSDNHFENEIKTETVNNEWPTTDTDATWD